MTVWPPRYEPRRLSDGWAVFDTFHQDLAWRADGLRQFEGMTQEQATAQADALNRIYERTL